MTFQTLLSTSVDFLNEYIIPLLIAVAFLAFIWNAYLYFIQKSDEPEGRERAKQHALWSIIAFLLFIMFWGIINIATTGFGIARERPLCPDIPGFPCFGSPFGSTGVLEGEYECTDLIFGMQWCSRGGTEIQGFGFEPGTQIQVEDGTNNGGDSVTTAGDSGGNQTGNETRAIAVTNSMSFPWSHGVSYETSGDPNSVRQASYGDTISGTCSEVMVEPRSSARFDENEKAYVLYKDVDGTYKLVDITFESDGERFRADHQKVQEIQEFGRDVHPMHTHPKNSVEEKLLGLVRKAPSLDDYAALCKMPGLTQLVVDGETIWEFEQTDPRTHCPMNAGSPARLELAEAETYGILAEVNDAERNNYIDRFIQEYELTEAHYIWDLLERARTMSTEELRAAQLNLLNKNGIRLREITVEDLCDDSTSA